MTEPNKVASFNQELQQLLDKYGFTLRVDHQVNLVPVPVVASKQDPKKKKVNETA